MAFVISELEGGEVRTSRPYWTAGQTAKPLVTERPLIQGGQLIKNNIPKVVLWHFCVQTDVYIYTRTCTYICGQTYVCTGKKILLKELKGF